MGRKSKSHKFNAVTEMAKNPVLNSETDLKDKTQMGDPDSHVPNHVVASKRKKLISKNKCVRRSSRLKSVVRHAQNQEIGHTIEEIDLVENEREEEPDIEDYVEQPSLESHETENEQRNNDAHNEPLPRQKTLDDKVDDLIRAFEEFKSKEMKGHVEDKGTSTSFNYKNLYLDSQKKIEDLTVENEKLATKLEIALAKLNVYDRMKEMMEKWQETANISNLTKATEAVVNLTSQVVGGQFSSPGGAVSPRGSTKMPKSSLANKRKRNETDN